MLSPNDETLKRGGKVALGPKSNPIIQMLSEMIQESFGYHIWYFNNTSELNKAARETDYGGIDPKTGRKKAICLGVIFDEANKTSAQYNYRLFYNLSSTPAHGDFKDITGGEIIPYQEEDILDRSEISSGLPLLINFIDQLILQEATSQKEARLNASILKVPTPAYKQSKLFRNLSFNRSIFVSFPACVIYLRLVYKILFEKEKGIQQNLSNMGMNIHSYYLSWILFYTTIAFFQSIIWTFILRLLVFIDVSWLVIFSLYFLYCFFYICLGFFVTTFFQNAKEGVIWALMILFIFFFGLVALTVNKSPSESFLIGVSISPMAALDRAIYIVLMTQSNFKEFSFWMIFDKIGKYKLYYYYVSTLSHSFAWILLSFWVNQVWGSGRGAVKHPLFCLGCKKRRKRGLVHPTSVSYLFFKKSGLFFAFDSNYLKFY